jgi:hypothetical protein
MEPCHGISGADPSMSGSSTGVLSHLIWVLFGSERRFFWFLPTPRAPRRKKSEHRWQRAPQERRVRFSDCPCTRVRTQGLSLPAPGCCGHRFRQHLDGPLSQGSSAVIGGLLKPPARPSRPGGSTHVLLFSLVCLCTEGHWSPHILPILPRSPSIPQLLGCLTCGPCKDAVLRASQVWRVTQ